MKKEVVKKIVAEGMKLGASISVGCIVSTAIEKISDKVRNQKSKEEQPTDGADNLETENPVKSKKYTLTELDFQLHGKPLYRIQALKDFGDVKKGDIGGYVESEKNLSHEGECWIYDDARVLDNAFVGENAQIRDTAVVKDSAKVTGNSVIKKCAKVFGNAKIDGNVCVSDNASVYGNARISGKSLISQNSRVTDKAYIMNSSILGNSMIYGNASVTNASTRNNVHVHGKARICGNINLSGNARVYENANITGDCVIGDNAVITDPNDYIAINGVYKWRNPYMSIENGIDVSNVCNETVTFYRGNNEMIYVYVDHLNVTLDEFIGYVKSEMKLTPESKEMLIDAVDFVSRYFHLPNKNISTEETETTTKESAE